MRYRFETLQDGGEVRKNRTIILVLAPRGFPWRIEVYGRTKVFFTYFDLLNPNFEGTSRKMVRKLVIDNFPGNSENFHFLHKKICSYSSRDFMKKMCLNIFS